jgi:hypothetical protein
VAKSAAAPLPAPLKIAGHFSGVAMTDEPEIEYEADEQDDYYPDTLSGPDGQCYFGTDVQTFLAHWCGKLGIETDGAAVIFGEGCSLAIVHPETGKVLTPEAIAKLVAASAPAIRRVQ